jgi:hypothetical protein
MWHPIEDSPKYGGIFIVWIEPPGSTEIDALGLRYTMQYAFAYFAMASKNWILEGDCPEHCRITHWRPAPDRPKL